VPFLTPRISKTQEKQRNRGDRHYTKYIRNSPNIISLGKNGDYSELAGPVICNALYSK
jgi:hypothetical protein